MKRDTTGSGSIAERRGNFRVWRRSTELAARLTAHLLPDPDGVFSEGEKIDSPWRSEATDKVRVEFEGASYFLKRYNRLGPIYALKNVLRPSRALRSWRAAELFSKERVPTPRPLLCLEERHAGLLGRSYVLFPFFAGDAGSLLDLWPRLDADRRQEVLGGLAALIGRMHGRGLIHGDLNWRNILLAREEGDFRFSLVDLDGSRGEANPNRELAEKDLGHFLRDLKRAGADGEFEEPFLSRWAKEAGFSGE